MSDTELADRVDAKCLTRSEPGGLSEVPALHGAFAHKPKNVLLDLARATRPLYDNDVHDTYRFWAFLRYIGIFADNGNCSYMLSEAASRVVGNQRRVLSEELGIGVSIGVAERWLADLTGGGPVRTTDVDVALSNASLEMARMRKAVQGVGPNRPDYLLVAEHATQAGLYEVATLECKGTVSPPHSLNQLAHASAQLRGITVGGRVSRGLAVSSVLQNWDVSYRALALETDPNLFAKRRARSRQREERKASRAHTFEARYDNSDVASRQDEEDLLPEPAESLRLSVDDEQFDAVTDVDVDAGPLTDLTAVVTTSVRASWSNLAELAGGTEAATQWAPEIMRLKKQRDAPSSQVTQQLPDRSVAVGTMSDTAVAGGRLRVLLGTSSELWEAIQAGRARGVLEAQRRVLQRQDADFRSSSALVARSSDGGVLAVFLD